jgi:hypothetical protein
MRAEVDASRHRQMWYGRRRKTQEEREKRRLTGRRRRTAHLRWVEVHWRKREKGLA